MITAQSTQLLILLSINYDLQIFHFLTLLKHNARRKQRESLKQTMGYFRGMHIGFIELNRVVFNLFGTVAHFVFLESFHGRCSVDHHCGLRLEKKGLHFRVSIVCPVITLTPLGERFLP